MSIRFEGPDGRMGVLDVVKLAQEEMNGVVTGAENGIVYVKTEDGATHGFKLQQWAAENQATIINMEGFNGPDTALDQPPNGMNYLDQSVFYQDGQDMNALTEMFQQSMKREDGRVVVLDNDGLWKTMWSPYLVQPLPGLSFPEQISMNEVNDPRLTMRLAGVTFMFALAGMETSNDSKGKMKIAGLEKALTIIGRNAPYENKFQIGKLLHQTTGIDPWKFYNALLAPEEVGAWMKNALKLSSFQFRMKQADMAELIVGGLRSQAQKEFAMGMRQLIKLDETKKLLVNLKQLFSEFIQFMVGMDLLRDISKTTGLQEWISLNEDRSLDPSKLPPMPEFVEKFVRMLRWMMPIVEKNSLSFARGKSGFKAIISIMIMIDDCIYSLAGVPDSSAKYKMFMALKKLQAQIETKLAFVYHPDPEKNKDGMKENPFMSIKKQYSTKREELYKICQLPKESWNNSLLNSLRQVPNVEKFYDGLNPTLATLMKSFAAMDVAYDMQPWVDVNHAERTHDPFSQYQESFGLAPPEAGYLAKNSPRAVQNIAETLVEGAGVLASVGQEEIRELLRNPYLLSNLIKTLMVASVNRELGTIEVLTKFGITQNDDREASPDTHRIWEDPEAVQKDIDKQVQELMGSMAMEAMMQQQQGQAQEQDAQMQEEEMRDQGAPPKAGRGPQGPPQQARQMRG